MTADGPALSVVLASGHGWSDAEPTLARLASMDPPGGMEIIFCDGSGHGTPPAEELDGRLRIVSMPGESVFALRARGIGRSRGEIVAITEDHCMPEPDWADALLAAHGRHPGAAAIAGAVTNGSSEGAWDWANFLMTFAEHMPPVPASPGRRAPSVANGSLKRSAVAIPPEPRRGWFELELMPSLLGSGKVMRDDGPRVAHIQSHGGARGTLAAHFHNGRACTGLRALRPGPAAALAERGRIGRLPFRLNRELREALATRPRLDGVAASGARLVPLVGAAHAAGELTGLLLGPGRSAEELE
jgi:hypothetical protein